MRLHPVTLNGQCFKATFHYVGHSHCDVPRVTTPSACNTEKLGQACEATSSIRSYMYLYSQEFTTTDVYSMIMKMSVGVEMTT